MREATGLRTSQEPFGPVSQHQRYANPRNTLCGLSFTALGGSPGKGTLSWQILVLEGHLPGCGPQVHLRISAQSTFLPGSRDGLQEAVGVIDDVKPSWVTLHFESSLCPSLRLTPDALLIEVPAPQP